MREQAVVIPRSVSSHAARSTVPMFSTQASRNFGYITLGHGAGDLVEVLSGVSTGEKLSICLPTRPRREAHRERHGSPAMKQDLGIAGRLAHAFINSKLTLLFIAASLGIGIFAVAIIPREEEPQILVPMLDHRDRHAGRIAGRGGRTGYAAHRELGPPNIGRRVCVLDVGAGQSL